MLLEIKNKKNVNKMTIVSIIILILMSLFGDKIESFKLILYLLCAIVGFFSTRYTFVIIVLTYTNFFSLFNGLEIQGSITDFGLIAAMICFLVESIRYIKENRYKITKKLYYNIIYILIILFLLASSIIVANIRYGQPIIRGIYAFRYFLVILYVFPFTRFLKRNKQEKYVIMEYLSKIIAFSIIIVIIQVLIIDKIKIVKLMRAVRLEKYRVLLHMASPLYIMVFAYNLYIMLNSSKIECNRIITMILIIIAIFVISQTRIFMVGILSVTLFEMLIFSEIKVINKIICAIIGVCIILIAFETNIINQIAGNLFEDVKKDGDSYIRTEATKYYMQLIDDDFFLFGGGITNEKYSNSPVVRAIEYNYYLADIGIYGVFFEYGILGVIVIIILTFTIFKQSFYIKDKQIANLVKMFCIMIVTTLVTVSPLTACVWILYMMMFAFIKSEVN